MKALSVPEIIDSVIDILVAVLEFDRTDVREAATIRELGVTSLHAIELLEKINAKFDLSQPTSVMFEFGTIRELASHLAKALAARADAQSERRDDEPAITTVYHEAPPLIGAGLSRREPTRSADKMRAEEAIDIAIIGLACRCAGANDKESFWSLVSEGRVSTQETEREDWREYFRTHGGSAKSIRYGAMSGVEFFDPLFFNISPKEAAAMDVSHRILLEESYKALEDAGYAPGLLKGSKVGTYVGAFGSSVPFPPDHSHYSMLGSDTSILASRLAFHLDLKGPSLAVNTSCSSSLVALDLGCRALRSRQVDLAIAGGITIWGHPHPFISMRNAGMLSPSGECRPFDSRADGILVGDGVGVLLLKRLEDAERDRDSIYGVVRGIGTNQDGQTAGITVPSFLAQSALQTEIYERAGINVEDIQYIEAHGTATKLGDPVEVHALTESFGKFTSKKGFCAIGSVKANIGHTGAAAGVMGVIKVLLSLRYRQLPPAVNFTAENPHIGFTGSPVYVNTTLREWVENSVGSRLAAVSSFGYSGTNAHVVLEEHSAGIQSLPSVDHAAPAAEAVLVPLSARTKVALRTNIERLHCFLSSSDLSATIGTEDALGAIAFSLQVGRDAMEHRLAAVVNSLPELRDRLRAIMNGESELPGCWVGQVESRSNGDLLLGGDDDARELIHNWTVKRRLATLARLWTAGASIDWMALYGDRHPRRVHLPTYSFASEPFALPTCMGESAGAAQRLGVLHPLLHRNTSDIFEQRFTSSFTGRERFFADHVIQGRRILPGVAYLEMARAAVEQGGVAPMGSGSFIRLRNVVWACPLAVDEPAAGTKGVDVHVGLFPDERGRIEFDVYTQPGDRSERVSHCTGVASFGDQPECTTANIDELRASLRKGSVDRDELYAAFEAAGIRYGPSHQAIEAVHVGDGQVLARLSLPRSLMASPLDGPCVPVVLHPSLMDAALQASTKLALRSGKCSSQRPALPFTLGELSIHGECSASMWAWARLSTEGATEKSLKTVDIDLLDDSGTVCVRLKGLGSRAMDADEFLSSLPDCALEILHPLVHRDRSTPNRRIFASTFNGSEFFLDDHRLDGQKVLPGAAYVEMVRAAGSQLGVGDVAGLKSIVWAQPIRFEDTPLEVAIRFEANADGYSYQVCTASGAAEMANTVHCQGRLLLNQVRSEGAPHLIDIQAINARCTVRKGHQELADDLRRVFGDYGTGRSFQAAEHLACNEDEALVTLELPECVRAGSSAYFLHPSMVNGAFEAAQLWSMVGSRDMTMQLPFAIEQIWIHGPLPGRAYAHIRRTRGGHRGATNASYDIDIVDGKGAVALSLIGYSTMPLSSSRRISLVYAAPRWRDQPLPSEAARTQTAEPIFILAQDAAELRAELARAWPRAKVEALGTDRMEPAEDACASLLQVFRLIQSCVKAPAKDVQPILVLIPQSESSYILGALNGLMRTAMRECPRIGGKITHYEATAALAPDLVAFLRAELDSGNAEVEIRRNRDGSRAVKRIEETDLPSETAIHGPAKGDVLWITGGLGGLGRILAEHFASRYGTTLILSGRSAMSSSGREFLAGLERCGSQVEYQQCDIRDERQVARLVAGVVGRYGRLTGIIHNAGLIQDALIVNKTEEQIRRVLGPKVIGTLSIQRATEDLDLEFLVLASSFGALFGNSGQADYSAANSFLDAFAEHRNRLVAQGRCHGRTMSINWPLWRSGGMRVTREAELLMERATGMVPMDTERGVQAFERVLRSGCEQVLVAQGDAERIRATLLSEGDGRRPGGGPSGSKLARPVLSGDATLIEEIQRGLVAAVSELQKVEAARVDLDTPLSRYGFDSIGFTELANILNRRYGFEEMPTVFFEYSDLRSVARHLVEWHRGLIQQRMYRMEGRAAEEPLPPVEPKTPVRGAGRIARLPRARPELAGSRLQQAARIAIIGVGAKFPGSRNLDEFWSHLESNRDLITEGPSGRWDWPGGRTAPGPLSKRRPITSGGFLSDVDRFDSSFFRISPREAEQMDPQLRVLLETVWATIEDAGYRASVLSGRRIGVFAGVGAGGYRELWEQSAPADGVQGAVGLYPFMVANRISYALNLQGPSEVIDTACSSSLVALHRAVESLRNGSCEMALVGGANIISSPSITLDASEAGVLSPDGRCKTFAKHADGYGRGEAVVAVLLKPLEAAMEAGDRIYAVIRGSAENHGGRATSPTAPNPAAQQALIVDAYTQASVDPRTVTYIEAHGTGTELGDPIEVKGLKGAFAELYRRAGYVHGDEPHCGLGSVKTNIGHSEAASGLAGVIKVLLMLRHRKIPGNVHLVEENSYLQLEGSPFYLVRETRDWPAMTDAQHRAMPRRAGVSSFGVGGTNVHLILEEYVHAAECTGHFSDQPHLIVLSARNEDRLKDYARNLLSFIDGDSRQRISSSGDGDAPKSPAMVEAEIRRIVAAALEVSESDLDAHEPFESYGFDRALRALLLEKIANTFDGATWTAELSGDDSIASVARSLMRKQSDLTGHDAAPVDGTRAVREGRGIDLRDLAYTLQVGREPMDERLGLIVRSQHELRECLNAFLHDRELPNLQRGRAEQRSDARELTKDAHLADAVDDLINQGRYAEILSLWVEGADVDWRKLYAGAVPRPITAPTYPFARERHWISGNGSAPSGEPQTVSSGLPASEQKTGHTTWDGVSYLQTWEEHPAEASTPRREHRATLIVSSDPSFRFEETIASHYRHLQPNATVIHVQLERETRRLAKHHYVCGIDDPDGFDRCLADCPEIDCVLFVTAFRDPAAFRPGEDLASSHERNEIQLLRLVKCLQQRTAPDSLVDCFVVTQDNHRAFGLSRSPCGGGLTGLAYSVAQGDHRLRLRNIDVSFEDLETTESRERLLTMILQEAPSDRAEAIKFQSGHRYEQRFQRLAWPKPGAQSGIRKGGVYVILGGSGTVGRITTHRLMRDYKAEVVWIGRREIDDLNGLQKDEVSACPVRPSLYVHADATDLASMTHAMEIIKRRYETVNGAIFSAVIFEDRNSVQETSEAQFRRILDVKTRGITNFYSVFEDEPLDFLCSFSSGQSYSFSGAAKFAAYAAGITFADCFLNSTREHARFPVGIVNWGFWARSLDGVSIHEDVGSLEDEEGFKCFESFVSALRQRVLGQVLCLRASEPVSRLMRVQTDQIVVCPEAGPASAMRQLTRGRGWRSPASRVPTTERGSEELNVWLRDLLFAQLLRLGAFSSEEQGQDRAVFGPNAGLKDRLEGWWHESLVVLTEHGYIRRNGARVVPLRIDEARDPWGAWAERKKAYVADPEMRDSVELIDRCLRRLPEVLRGDVPATEVLFPRSSLDGVKSLYTRDTVADYFNKTLAAMAGAYVDARVSDEPKQLLRILEIGAGTGGTSASVLERLAPQGSHIGEYRYTDLSKAFLLHGLEHYGSIRYLRFELANIDEPLTGQGIEPGAYDIVIAGNVLHASRNVRAAVWNIKSALRRQGLLLLNELVDTSLFAHLTFGLLEGWWNHDDAALRIPGSPILSSETWRRVLGEAGFLSVLFPTKAAASLGQQIIVAESDGFCKRTAVPGISIVERTEPGSTPAPIAQADRVGMPGTRSRELVSRVIRESLSRALKIPIDALDLSVQFSELGMDSLLGVRFVDEINGRLGIRLNRAIIFDYSSVDRLTRYVIDTFGERFAAETSAAPQIAAEASPPMHGRPSAATVPPDVVQHTPPSTHKPIDIAVVGMSGQFPGATDVATLWANLEQGRDCVGELPSRDPSSVRADGDVWSVAGCRWGGVLENRDCFDPLFFNISPREALSMSPHQRLVLQEGWRAIEDAGYNPRALANSAVGVFIGAEPSRYAHESFTGASDAIVASRLSYSLDLKGPALVVNTGCSSSAVAIHLACQSLRQMESIACLAGGVFVSSGSCGAATPAEMLSPTGRCRTFDDRADGTVFSEGVGVVMLKRLADALTAGDAVYGVIQASGINQDGASNGITAPNGIAQEALIVDVYRRYGIDPDDISYVEAHGTGTKLGDPVEGNALVRAFKQFTARRHYCAIGSAKANIGHTGAGAGVIGLIKLLLALKHRRIPGLLHFENINSSIELEESAFFVSKRSSAWRPDDGRRRVAALNSFGHGGTNAHIVVAEYAAGEEAERAHEEITGPYLILLSAKNGPRLRDAAKNLRDHLLQMPEIDMVDLGYTLQVGRDAMKERAALLVDTTGELSDRLRCLVEGQPNIERCWQGGAAESKGRIRLLSSDDDMKELIGRWIVDGKLAKLAELWVQGLDIDWHRMYGSVKRRRLHLPTYVFDNEHFWAPQSRGDDTLSLCASEVVRRRSAEAEPPGTVTLAPEWNRVTLPDGAPLVPEVNARTVVVGGTGQQHAEVRLIYSRAFAIEACEAKTDAEVAAELDGSEPIEHVIWLASPTTTFSVADESLLEEQERGVILVFRLVKALLSLGYGDRDLSWTLVTTGAQATYPNEAIDPTHAGVHGLAGSIAKEYPAWRMRLIDVAAGHDSSLRELFTLPFDAQGSALAGRNKQWLRQTLIEVRNLESAPPVYRRDGVYVVIGGAGAIGQVWSRWVIERYQARVIWIGRRNKDDEIQRNIDALSQLGPSPLYVQADASDRSELQRAYEAMKRINPRIHGVIHSAVGLFYQSLAASDEPHFRAVLSAKVDVSVRLAQVFGAEPLELALFFSSVSAFGKGGGLSGYAAGCSFADAFARRLRTEWAGKVKVINWGYWNIGAGALLSDTAKARLAHDGLGSLEPAEGMKVLDRLLSSPLSQLACLHTLKPGAFQGTDAAGPGQHLIARATPVESTESAPASAKAELTSAQELRERSTSYFKHLVGRTLRMDTALIGPSEPLISYGMDSILIVQVTDKLRNVFGEINSTLLFETQSIDALVDYFLDTNRESLAKLVGLNEPADEIHDQPQEPAATITPAGAEVVRDRFQPQPTAGPLARQSSTSHAEPIAIIGLSGRYPHADSIEALWHNLESGKECIEEIPADRWPMDTFFHPDPQGAVEMGRSYSKWGGFLSEYACFDPDFFKVSRLEAMAMDPQERLFLEGCWEVLEDAGYTRETLRRDYEQRVGVFVGVTKNGYSLYAPELWRQGESTYPYTSFSSVANRVSYVLDLRGPSFPIDTMCSSSLTAIHEACEHLHRQECAMAIAGGVNLYLHPLAYIGLSSQQMLSADGRCRSFGAGANGFVPGEGFGVVLLKPLARAVQDRDRIHAVIRGTSVNHGGRTGGYTVPNPIAQGQVIRAALDRAGVSAEAVSYVEAHGTGTELGDPIEIQGLTWAFRKDTDRTGYCSVGSLKSNLGHLESAAGIAGLTKVILQMKHRMLVPSLHASEPNPHIDFEKTPFVVQRELAEWKRPIVEAGGEVREYPRIAGLSSFGAGGSNAHVVIEEYIPDRQDEHGAARSSECTSDRRAARSQIIPLSARTEERLSEYARRLYDFLQKHQRRTGDSGSVGPPAVELRDVAYTLQVGREAMECRLGLVVESVDELIEKLGRFLDNDREIHGLHLGKVGSGDATTSVFAADEDFAGTFEAWIEKRKYSRIVELWVKGFPFDWRKLHATAAADGRAGPRRIGLPTYPFAKERYWMPAQSAGAVHAASPSRAAPALHPLVHANTSDFATQRYTSTFTGRETFLADHVVRGERVMPAVAYLEMVRAAMAHASPKSSSAVRGFALRDVVWLRPLAVGPSGRRVHVRLAAQVDSYAAFEVCTDGAPAADEAEVHCQGTAAFRVVAKADALDLADLRASLNLSEISSESLYDALATMAIDYGASHRCVETVFVGHRQVLVKLTVLTKVKASQVDSLDEIVLNIGLVDAALQASVALGMCDWLRGYDSMAAQRAGDALRPALPFAAEEIEISGDAGACEWAWVRYADGSSPGDAIQRVDIDCCDSAGEIRVRIRGFSSKAVVDRVAEPSLKDATGLMMLSPVWETVRSSSDNRLSPEADAQIAVVGGTEERRQAIRALYRNARVLDLRSGDDVEAIANKLSAGKWIEHLVWLPPSGPLESAFVESVIEDQESGVLQLFRIIKALLSLGYEHRSFGCTVLTEQVCSLQPDDLVNPTHAGVHGLVGSLAKEYPQWRIRLLDLAAGETCPECELFAQPFDADGDCLVHRSWQWSRQRLAHVRTPSSDRFGYRENGTYVVIGGAGGIGETWTRSVLSSHKARVVWIGRRGNDASIQAKLEDLRALGPVPTYIQADASDRRALEAARREIVSSHGQIHGVIHSAIVLLDRSIANMDEEQFLAVLRGKIDVSVRLAQVFQHDNLDFVLFFSSLTAFGKSAGQSNYAAGSTFADAFARRLAQDWPCAVKVMNWGYWGGVGIVADAAHRERMRRAGIGSLEPAEGTRAVEELLQSPLDQLALVRTLSPDALGSATSTQYLTTYRETIPSCIHVFSRELPAVDVRLQHLITDESRQRSATEDLLLQIVWSILRTPGLIPEERGSLGDLASGVKLPGLHSRWLEETTRMLEASGILRIEAGHWVELCAPKSLDALWEQWNRTVAGWKEDPARASLVLLLENCLRALPQIALGERLATDAVFPNSSLDLVEGVYRGSPVVDYFSDALAKTVVLYLEERLSKDPAAEIRLIEVGAGTGGTTAGLLPRLDGFRDNIKEYCYTDISRAFLMHSEDRYAQRYPYLTTRLFDVSRPIADQSIDGDRYDLVLAANVLHATADIRWALRNAKATLRRNGLLILNEISDRSLLTHLTFGLLEGWWLYEDRQLRIPGCPGLYPEVWKRTLSEEGFRSVRFAAQAAHALGQQIIVAESDGIVRQELRQSNAPQRSTMQPGALSVDKALGASPTKSEAPAFESLRALSLSHVKRMVAATLKMSPVEIDASRPLEEYGVDSILVVRITNALRKEFDGISSTLLFEVRSIEALVEHLLKTQKQTLVRLVGLDEEPVATRSEPLRDDASQPAAQPALRRSQTVAPVAPQRIRRDGHALRPQDIAVIGLSGRYPQARDVNAFMANLSAGRNCITEIPRSRWNWEQYYDEKKGEEGRMYSKWGGFLDDVDKFDPLFFRISPREAERMDPQERLFLQIAYSAVEDAGYTPATLCESRRVGVFVGAMNSMYAPEPSHYSIANRISYLMDFTGPSLAVDTACSSSLTAIHLALESLYGGSSDCAIAGGVSLILDPVHYLTLSEMSMLSATDACKPFGDRADGFVDGEGVGAVVLKPLRSAVADRDHIYGVIKGSMVNASGKTNGYTVPNPRAQAQLILEALNRAGVKARDVSYVEAHGTGTALGDPIEIAGLTQCFERATSDKQFCAIGSVKSNIGHCESAAGIAGLTKVLLQIREGRLVPSLHAEELNREIDFENTPFFVQRDLADWERPTYVVDGETRLRPRIAGVSSFGAGGANAHIVIEEYIKEAQHCDDRELKPKAQVIVLSAREESRLREMAGNLRQFVLDATDLNLSDLAYTLQVGRESMEERIALIVRSPEELAQKLERFLAGGDVSDVFRGQVRRDEETLAVFGADDELRGAIEQWIRHRKYSALLSLWVKGLVVDWAKLHEGIQPRRVSAPTYPFARERYWAESPKAGFSGGSNGHGANGHPAELRDRSFHEQMLDRLSAHEIGIEDAIRAVRPRR